MSLIKCKECGLQISSKAPFCPHCGFIIDASKIRKIAKPKKLPNGFGQITKISNKSLRRPYRAMVTIGHNEYGKPISKLLKPVAYFETYNDAYQALIDHAKNPYSVNRDATLRDIYEEWIVDYGKNLSDSRVRNIKYTWKKLIKYYDVKLADFKPKVISNIIDEFETDTGENRKKIKSLFNLIMDYAVINEIIDKNYSRISNIKILDPDQVKKGHISFTDEEISTLWNNLGDLYVRWALIQCYTGMRPSELCLIKLENIFLDDNYMIGGIKTAAGSNRIIPIHEKIKEIVIDQINQSKSNGSEYLLSRPDLPRIAYDVYKRCFYEVKDKYHLNPEHTPHDCRKYFISQAKKYQVDEYALKRIVGHKISDLTENIYTVRDTKWLVSEINKIIV